MNNSLQDDFLKQLNQHSGILHKICNSYFMNPQVRQDAFQEMVYQLWKSYPSFRADSKFSTWMYRVALNTAILLVRKSNKRITEEELNEAFLEMPKTDDHHQPRETMDLLYKAIYSLQEIERGIILLYLDDYSYEEIATVMGISKSNVSVRLVRIKSKLEEKLKHLII
jgi:RNA polymerase sigma-70 factor (ECF subfamily)